MVEYVKDNIQGGYRPSLYPGEGNTEDWGVPPEHSRDFERLNSIIENKYTREYLKICAFYNKLFPSLKESSWETSSYNTIPFTTMDQERSDTGTGINFNYLKQIVDHITSRIGTISFVPTLMSEDQSIEYLVYKDEAERVIRMLMKKDKLNKKAFPQKSAITLTTPEKEVKLGMTLKYIKHDSEWEPRTEISNKYREVTVDEILRRFMSL